MEMLGYLSLLGDDVAKLLKAGYHTYMLEEYVMVWRKEIAPNVFACIAYKSLKESLPAIRKPLWTLSIYTDNTLTNEVKYLTMPQALVMVDDLKEAYNA